MDLQQALTLFNLPFTILSVKDTGVSVDYQLNPEGSAATLNRLTTRIPDIQAATGLTISTVLDGGLWLRTEKTKKSVYNYRNYGGYVYERYGDLELPYMLGMTANECVIEDLAKAPHLLVAGTTGSGKSNYLHTLADAILCNDNAHLIMLDCKKVEFSVYRNCANVYTDIEGAYLVTAWMLQEIERRYTRMEEYGIDTFKALRQIEPETKYNVFIIDELADLISNKEAKKVIIPRLLRIAQIGRAAGCHLVLATQRPDHTVINGTLKGNIPTRIAFNCASSFDSRVILDKTGAEHLTGNGDGLYLRNGSRDLIRFQACYLPIDNIKDTLQAANLL